jgi:hypothetical protein
MTRQHGYAQTFPQLGNQVLTLATRQDQERLGKAYQLALRIFGNCFRASGKPFIAHGIGTASIALRHGGGIELMLAGLLHAAYTHGDFGWRWPGDPAHRAVVRKAVGAEVEAIVHRYAQTRWRADRIAGWVKPAYALDDPLRKVLFLRLCNELEEHLDLGLLYCGETKIAEAAGRTAIPELAEMLGQPALAGELRAAMEATASRRIAEELVNPTGAPSTSVILTGSHQRTWAAVAVGWARALRRRGGGRAGGEIEGI